MFFHVRVLDFDHSGACRKLAAAHTLVGQLEVVAVALAVEGDDEEEVVRKLGEEASWGEEAEMEVELVPTHLQLPAGRPNPLPLGAHAQEEEQGASEEEADEPIQAVLLEVAGSVAQAYFPIFL